jgi:DNA topoisomerase I
MPRLRRVDCSGPGIVRRGRGRGFEYLDEDGERIDDPEALQRIRELVIPPAWKDVWICPYPEGHIQAVGTDARGRRQYLYHPQWRARRDQEKFDEMLRFARALPGIRRTAARHLAERGLTRDRVLACSVRLLDRGFFRVGGEGYAEEHGTYGLATMEKRHVTLGARGLLVFDYVAKSGKERVQSVVDPEVYAVVKKLKERRGGPELLVFKDGRSWSDVRSDHINEYIKEISGEDFSAKDFRTWHGTVLAAVALAVSGRAAGSKTARERAISRAVKEVSHYLGNTPAVCRASYIDPRVFDRYRDRITVGGALDRLGDVDLGEPATQGAVEEAVLALLEESESPALEKVA